MKKIAFVFLSFVMLIPFIQFHNALGLQIEMPCNDVKIIERTDNSTYDPVWKGSLGLGVDVNKYIEDDPDFGGMDVSYLRIAATASSRGILEYNYDSSYYSWHDITGSGVMPLDDDEIGMILLPWKVRFYGGPGSGEYEEVLVCSNGWLAFFDVGALPSELFPDRWYGETIPNSIDPNVYSILMKSDLPL